MDKTKIIEVIYTQERRGLGRTDDPVRLVTQLWSKDGNLIMESDPCGQVSEIDDPLGYKNFITVNVVNTNNIETN